MLGPRVGGEGTGRGWGNCAGRRTFFLEAQSPPFFPLELRVVFLVEFMKYTKKNVGSKMAKLQTLFLKS